MKEWLVREWKRTGLPLRKANEACGVKDAATRKYFDQGWLWYMPPPEIMEMLVNYANTHGSPKGAPYFSLNGAAPVSAKEWADLRSVWNHEHGVTNVWNRPALRGAERFKGSMRRSAPRVHNPSRMSASHLNQKPLDLVTRLIQTCTVPGDTVWEPFGGLCTAMVAAVELDRMAFGSELDPYFAMLARERLEATGANRSLPVANAPAPASLSSGAVDLREDFSCLDLSC